MNFGFNTNVRVGAETYHVQTEDRGTSHPFLDTVVYLAGQVVYKRSASYEKYVKVVHTPAVAKKLQEHLVAQHRDVIAALEAGTLPLPPKAKPQPAKAKPGARAATVAPDALEVRLQNPKSWCVAGNASLTVAVQRKTSQQPVNGADVNACLEQGKQRIPCGRQSTDAQGAATIKFQMPAEAADGATLVVRATEGTRFGELRFRLGVKPRKTPPRNPRENAAQPVAG